MKCLLYYCIIFITAHFLDARVVILKPSSSQENDDAVNSSNSNVNEGNSQENLKTNNKPDINSDENNNSEENIEHDKPDGDETNVSVIHGFSDEDEKINDKNAEDKGQNEQSAGQSSETDDGFKTRLSNNKTKEVEKGRKKEPKNDKTEDKNKRNTVATGGKKEPTMDKTGYKKESKKSEAKGENETKEAEIGNINKSVNETELNKQLPDKNKNGQYEKSNSKSWDIWDSEVKAGNSAEMYGTNPHLYQPDKYPHLNRRFVPQYPYTYVKQNNGAALKDQEIIPIEASPEIVELVAKKSALIEALKPKYVNENLTQKMLRSGDYWNGVWKEDMYPKRALRNPEQKPLGTIKTRIMPGSDFYNIVAKLKKISPKLLYIINVDH